MTALTKTFIPRFLGFGPTGDLGALTIYTDKRGNIVAFPKSPPLLPPTYWQVAQRNRFRLAGQAWQTITATTREQWNTAAKRLNAAVTGYNLFLYWQLTDDMPAIRTIERQTHTRLITCCQNGSP